MKDCYRCAARQDVLVQTIRNENPATVGRQERRGPDRRLLQISSKTGCAGSDQVEREEMGRMTPTSLA